MGKSGVGGWRGKEWRGSTAMRNGIAKRYQSQYLDRNGVQERKKRGRIPVNERVEKTLAQALRGL